MTGDIEQFAAWRAVRVERDGCGHSIVAGWQFCRDMPERKEYSARIFDSFSDSRLGVCLMFETGQQWGSAQEKLLATGFTLKQNAYTEGTPLFDPANDAQSRLALEVCCVPRGIILEAA